MEQRTGLVLMEQRTGLVLMEQRTGLVFWRELDDLFVNKNPKEFNRSYFIRRILFVPMLFGIMMQS